MYLRVFWLLLLFLLSIYKFFFLLDCVIYTYWGTLWKKFIEPPQTLNQTYRDNYLLWKAQFVPYLKVQHLYGYGSIPIPTQAITTQIDGENQFLMNSGSNNSRCYHLLTFWKGIITHNPLVVRAKITLLCLPVVWKVSLNPPVVCFRQSS